MTTDERTVASKPAEAPGVVDRLILGVTLLSVALSAWVALRPTGIVGAWWHDLQGRRADRAAVVAEHAHLDLGSVPTTVVATGASVTTVYEFFDYECPFCLQSEDSLRTVLGSTHAFTVRRVNFPLGIHANAHRAAAAALCAAEAGRGDAMHEYLVRTTAWKVDSTMLGAASAAGVADTRAFGTCLTSAATEQKIADDLKLGERLKVDGTPTLFSVHGRYVGLVTSGAATALR